ncbi:uncharacterized protein THITE_2113606 [Thermothielavioides terrestris NRRL 8126]|uniref:Uncharacterized protein n=1 Tax=Thermothielavioides terrestris (strain ATCC 38088 / NRRL 8126) TaxID=578455 RepID=G2R3D8_THETT|nr:uncharacterized protein THITE_2113606 [Thermothielavioides terrestris NRRL 8126]AEO65949.1 hypothetical protein THITE_2113606 [Thermothielavioides terrestris NRRL 8126]
MDGRRRHKARAENGMIEKVQARDAMTSARTPAKDSIAMLASNQAGIRGKQESEPRIHDRQPISMTQPNQ